MYQLDVAAFAHANQIVQYAYNRFCLWQRVQNVPNSAHHINELLLNAHVTFNFLCYRVIRKSIAL